MQWLQSHIQGVFQIVPELIEDERGFFARLWCETEAEKRGLVPRFAQESIAYNVHEGTLRGLHMSTGPHAETKLVRCAWGMIYDVVVDMRPDSPTYLGYDFFTLSMTNRRQVYIPSGIAHGYLTATPSAEVSYRISPAYSPEVAAAQVGFRYDDPALAIKWPEIVKVISDRDRSWPLFKR